MPKEEEYHDEEEEIYDEEDGDPLNGDLEIEDIFESLIEDLDEEQLEDLYRRLKSHLGF